MTSHSLGFLSQPVGFTALGLGTDKSHSLFGSVRNRLQSQSISDCFWDAFAKLRKATISFGMPIHPSAWSDSAPNEGILMKLDIELFLKICRENSSLIKLSQE